MKLFLETEVGDITGKIIKTEKEHIFTKEQIQAVVSSFNNWTY